MSQVKRSLVFLDDLSQKTLLVKILNLIIPIFFMLALTGIYINVSNGFHINRFLLNFAASIILIIAYFFLKTNKAIVSFNLILFGSLIIFGSGVLFNGGVKTPNYVGFLAISVLASIFSSTRFIWLSYLTFIALGALTLVYPFYDPKTATFPADYRYYTIYGVLGFVISLCLVVTRETFNRVVEKLAEKENLLSSAFNVIQEPLLIFNESGEMTYLNPSAEQLNTLLQQVHQQNLDELVMFDMLSKTECSLKSLISDRLFVEKTQVYKTHTMIDQRSLWYSISISPYRSMALGSGALVVIRDITEQQRLTQNQKMQAIGRLSNGMAHDFNNMLGAIKSANDLLMLDLDEEHHDLLKMIDEATDRSANMIKQLRLFSKRNDSEESAIELNTFFSDITLILQSMNQRHHSIIVECPEKLFFKGVVEHLHSLFMNLGLNALQAMSGGGTLRFRVQLLQLNQKDSNPSLSKTVNAQNIQDAEFEQVKSQKSIVIEVIDEGVGISPDLQERIFEPFFTTRKQGEGSGLGLSIAHGVIQRHHGVIEVLSQVGQGTTMRVIFPYDDTLLPSQTNTQELVQTDSFEGVSILIIDDEALIRQSLSAICRSLGCTITLAETGDQGLNIVREQISSTELNHEKADSSPIFNLIILDMLMPGKNGHEVFLELQEFASHIPVILSSGFYPEDALNEMNQKGLAGQLHKPYGLKQVKQMLTEVLFKSS